MEIVVSSYENRDTIARQYHHKQIDVHKVEQSSWT